MINTDPLMHSGPDRPRTLFEAFSKTANGFTAEDALGASVNIIINALRQAHPSRDRAERAFDELFGRTKQLLMDHYDSIGRLRGVFPYDQVIEVPHFDLRDEEQFLSSIAKK